MRKLLLGASHAAAIALGVAAGAHFAAGEPSQGTGFTLIERDPAGHYVARALVYGTDGLLHEVSEVRP